MHFDTDGIYTLQYTATDSCGNETIEERTVEVTSYMTTLFADGTFIINEKSSDRVANIALHGAVTDEFAPFDPNGDTDVKKYIFSSAYDRPWGSKNIMKAEIGSPISPYSTANWFKNTSCGNGVDLTLLDASRVTNMRSMFENCDGVQSLDLSHLDTSAVTDMSYMFCGCDRLATLNVDIDTSAVTNMEAMFGGCHLLTSIDVSSFNTSNVTNMAEMFTDITLTSLDLQAFDTKAVENMREMFLGCASLETIDLSSFESDSLLFASNMFNGCRSLRTIYASPQFNLASVSSSFSANMFLLTADLTANLVGGAGTTWAYSNPRDKTYAHIDGGTSNPGYFTAKA